MNALAFTNEPPFGAFGGRSMSKARVPSDGDANGPAIHEVHDQRVNGHVDALRAWLGQVTRQR